MRVNEEIDRRVPRVDATGLIPIPVQAPPREVVIAGPKRKVGHVLAGLLAIAALIAIAIFLLSCARQQPAKAVESRHDGSTAGANAVTEFELRWAAGEYSVTLEDLEREHELGEAYPMNGKEAFLDSDTTYNKGGGMVDMITLDKQTNVMIRHYGQLLEDGTVRWYAAETVLDEYGQPAKMPRG